MYLVITKIRTYEMITGKTHLNKIRHVWQDFTEIVAVYKWVNGEGWAITTEMED